MEVLTVSEVNRRARILLERDEGLQQLFVEGELLNVKIHSSGHVYFSIRDEKASLRVVMFRSRAQSLAFRPENGQKVIVRGRISLFERDGAFQLYAEWMEPAGLGAQHLALQQLRERLAAEGLFDEGRKRPLPLLPLRVGVITSATGAAVRDIITVARRRHPGIGLVLAPVTVQGQEAPALIAAAVQALAAHGRVDVIIVGRGGGSQEDLWAFNDESVVRAVAGCPVPVVSAVGHEIDVTLVDFAADHRAPTPSAAAELAVPVLAELRLWTAELVMRLRRAEEGRIQRGRDRLSSLSDRRPLRRPRSLLEPLAERVDRLERGLAARTVETLLERKGRFWHLAGRLDGLSPLGTLARGFAVVEKQGRVVREAGTLEVGDVIRARLARGAFSGRVEAVEGDV